MSKLTLLHINIIGIVTTLLLAIILFFVLVKPKQDDIATTQASLKSTIDAHGTPEDVAQHKKDLEKTKKDAAFQQAEWAKQAQYYMPALPYTDKSDPMQAYFFQPVGTKGNQRYGFRDLPTVYGRWLTAWYDAQRNSGVARQPGTEFPIDAFPPDPNYIATIDHLTFPKDGTPWPVNLDCKSFDDAMAHLRRFNTMQKHGMPVVNNVALSGQSPHLNLSYTLALYIIPATAAPPADPRINGAKTGAAAGMGGMGGMMGGMRGMPGMPPGMMGGSIPAGAPIGGGMMGGKGAKSD
jgi:hypothetical protein